MKPPHNPHHDKNFDDLAERFTDKIHSSVKGRVRRAVLDRDLAPYLEAPGHIVDAGGGQGQYSLALLERASHLTLCDISSKMLAMAKAHAPREFTGKLTLLEQPLQTLPCTLHQPADLLLCHAVLEWLAKPQDAIPALWHSLRPGGICSLMFFNVNSLIFKNLLRANYTKIRSQNFVGTEGSLTPINPLKIDDVQGWCETQGFTIVSRSGVRVFHDYILDPTIRAREPDSALAEELDHSQREPFWRLGRYCHFVLHRPLDELKD